MKPLETIRAEFGAKLTEVGDLRSLDELRVAYLGKKGEVKALLKQTGGLPPEERSGFGQQVNALKNELEAALGEQRSRLEVARENAELAQGWLDPTLPRQSGGAGRLHPITRLLAEVIDHFHGLGYSVASGPEIEDTWHNFDALNIPADHPARDGHALRSERVPGYRADDQRDGVHHLYPLE